MYRVVLTKRAVKGLDKAPEHISKKANEAIVAIQDSFAPVKLFDAKKLRGLEDTFRIRLGDWRPIYKFRKRDSTET